jgi:hypothetical protein
LPPILRPEPSKPPVAIRRIGQQPRLPQGRVVHRQKGPTDRGADDAEVPPALEEPDRLPASVDDVDGPRAHRDELPGDRRQNARDADDGDAELLADPDEAFPVEEQVVRELAVLDSHAKGDKADEHIAFRGLLQQRESA